MEPPEISGLRYYPARLDPEAQRTLLADVRTVAAAAPLYTPTMPRSGRPLSVRMTNAGLYGWLSDVHGYRYAPLHPITGAPWPPIPAMLLQLWIEITGYSAAPECCLVNFYGPDARMGLHRDENERDPAAPVLSVSLGDDALFRIGGATRQDRTRSFRLRSGDVLVLGGKARHYYHGVDRIYSGTSTLLRQGGRINLTLRRITRS